MKVLLRYLGDNNEFICNNVNLVKIDNKPYLSFMNKGSKYPEYHNLNEYDIINFLEIYD